MKNILICIFLLLMSWIAPAQIKIHHKPFKTSDLPSEFVSIELDMYKSIRAKQLICDSLVQVQSTQITSLNDLVKYRTNQVQTYALHNRKLEKDLIKLYKKNDMLHLRIRRKRWLWALAPAGILTGMLIK